MNSRFIKFMTSIISFVFFLPCTQALSADYSISTTSAWNGSDEILGWGPTPSYGQTFTAPVASGGTVLNNFSLYLKQYSGVQQNYKFYLYNWGGTAPSGAAVFTSGPLTAPSSSSFTKVTFNTNNTPLTSGGKYLAVISTLGLSNSSGSYYAGFIQQSSYTGGDFTYSNSATSIEDPTWLTWAGSNNADLAFELAATQAVALSN